MNLCSDDHDEVCYEGRWCPVCDMKNQRDSLQRDYDKAEERIEELQEEIKDMEASNESPA